MTVVLTAPAVSVPASAVAAHSTARVSPPLLGAADIDEDRLRMIDCRAAIEEVAHPVVIDYFKQRWSLTAHICGGCSKLHPFSGIQKSCLLYLVRSLYSYNSAVQGVQRLSAKISNIEQCLQDQFDLGALCNIVRDFDEEFSGPADVDSHLSCLTKCRGNCYHKSVIDEPERKQLFLDVERACSAITLSVQKWSKWSVQSIKDKLTAIPNHHGDAMRKFKDQILRESKRSTDEKVLHLLSASFAVDVGRRSRQIADLLCSDKHFKFLVIPPLAQGAAKTGDRTIRSDYQNQLRFLLDVPWTAVLDFNQLWFADHSDMSTLDQDALGSRLEVTTSLRATELSTYGKSCTLYTSLPSELVKLRDHNQDMHCYIVLVGFGDLDCSRSATSSLQSSLISITSALFVNERNWSLVPIITDAISANSSPMAAVLDMAKEENEKDEGSDTSEYKRFASFLCDVEFIESFISGRVRNNLNVLLPAAEKFHYRVGYPAKALQKFSDCLEVLTCDCDERALHVTPDEVQGLEENFSAAQVKQEILALELKRFLCGGKRTSWLLLKEGKIVRRSIVDSIIEAIVSKDFQSITLQHCIGTGATTVARNVLYELRHKFLCVVISNSSGEFSKISELLRTLQNKAALPLLVLLDLNASQDRLYNIRSQLVREDVTFLCTAFFEKGRKFQKANSAAGASTDVGSKSYDKGEAEFELPFELLPGDEQVQLSKLMVTSKQVVLDGVPIDSTFFTPLGHLDVDRVLKLDVLKNSLLSKSNEYLLNIGLCPIDVVYLRNSRFYSSRDTTSVYAKQRREIMLSPLFYGLFALDKDYARRASLYALKILERMENAEIQVIKLCCLYALFAPTEKLHNKLASYIYHGNTMRSDAVDWSVAMRQLVAFDCTSPGFMSIKVLPLSYVLARSPHIFGEEREWHSTVPNYLLETLFVLLEQSSYQLDLLNMLESGFLQAFVEFKIWHPERTRPIFFNGKRLRYSFLLEYILFYTAKQSGGELVRGIMNRLRLLYRNFPSHTIATHTARFLTNLAHSEQLFKYLLEAERILLEREEGLNYATVCDRLGHVYKTHVRIISKLISEGKLTLQFTAVAEPVCSPTGGYLAQRPYHNYSDMAAVSFDTVCEIAMEADRWFVKAMKIARYSVPNPMIGAVQVWTKVLAIIKFSLCSDREDRFRQYYSGPHQHELQPGVFQRIRDLDVFEYCNDRLHSARNALKYKKKLGEKDGNIDRDFFAVHGQESTKEMIWELWTTINKYINVTTPVRKFSGYNRVLAKHWMAVKNNHELSCDKLVFCMLSFADAMFPVDVVSKRSKKSAKSPPIPHSAQQKAIQASDDALLHATAVELFFQASCMLTKFSADEVCDAVEFFSKFRLDLVSHLRPITLEPQLSRWIDHVKAGDSFGLSARVSKLALIIWQILLNGDLNAFDALKKCMRELEVDSEQYQFTNKSRLFLARANSAPCNPFTAYYFAEDLPFKDKLAGPYRDHEPVYACAESYDCLFVCEGVLKQTERGRFVVECAQLQLDDIFMFSDNADPSLADNYQVTFVLALRDGGLVAHGVRVKPSK